jgi:hypothetical protein
MIDPNHFPDDRINPVAPALPAQDLVMPHSGFHVMRFHVPRYPGAQPVRRQGLPNGAGVVTFSFDREQRSAPNGCGMNNSSRTLEFT